MRTTLKQENKMKGENKMEEVAVLWNHTSESNINYLSGNLSEKYNYSKLIAFYNETKKNEKEPDIRVYLLNEENKRDHEVISLWKQVSKDDKKYLSGLTDEKEKVVAFYTDDADIKKPYLKIYLSK